MIFCICKFPGGRKVNRPREDGEAEREAKKITGNSNWYKHTSLEEECDAETSPGRMSMNSRLPTGGKMKEKQFRKNKNRNTAAGTEAILFLPMTPGNKLVKLVQKAEDQFAKLAGLPRVKVVERGGTKISSLLCKSDPWARGVCLELQVTRPDTVHHYQDVRVW